MLNVWSAFLSLNSARTSAFNGFNPITYTEIKSYDDLTDAKFKVHEIEAIKKLDLKWLEIMNG